MKITRNNYESFFLDYLEDEMDVNLQSELFAFLDRNPDLKEELDAFKKYKVQASSINLAEKTDFYKTGKIDASNEDEYFIAFHEGDLKGIEKTELVEYLSAHPQKKQSFDAFGRVKVNPEKTRFNPGILYQPNDLQLKDQMELVALTEGDKTYEEVASVIIQPDGEKTFKLLQKIKLYPDLNLTFPGKINLRKSEPIIFYLRPALAAAAVIILFFIIPVLFQNKENVSISDVFVEKYNTSNSTTEIEAIPDNLIEDKLENGEHITAEEKNTPAVVKLIRQKDIVKSKVQNPALIELAVSDQSKNDSLFTISPLSPLQIESIANNELSVDTASTSILAIDNLKNTEERITENYNKSEHVPTVLEFVVNRVSEAAINEKIIDQNKLSVESLAQGLTNKTPWVRYQRPEETEDEYSRLTVSVGKFQFKRSKKQN